MPEQLLVADGHGVSYWIGSAQPDKNDTSGHEVTVFDDGEDHLVTISGVMPINYGGGDLNVYLHFASWLSTTGSVVWQVEFERLAEDGNATNTLNFTGAQSNFKSVSPTLAALRYIDFTFTNAQAAGIQPGASFRIRVTRLGSTNPGGNDTLAGPANLFKAVIDEAT